MFITLNVALGERSYPILIGSGLLSRRELIEPHLRRRDVMVVTNETVGPIYLEPVRALLTLVTPTVYMHLQLLSRLSFALHDAGFKAVISEPGTREAILGEARRVDALLDERARAEQRQE